MKRARLKIVIVINLMGLIVIYYFIKNLYVFNTLFKPKLFKIFIRVPKTSFFEVPREGTKILNY